MKGGRAKGEHPFWCIVFFVILFLNARQRFLDASFYCDTLNNRIRVFWVLFELLRKFTMQKSKRERANGIAVSL